MIAEIITTLENAILSHIKRQFQVEKSKPHAINGTEKERIRLDGIFFFSTNLLSLQKFSFLSKWVTRLGFETVRGKYSILPFGEQSVLLSNNLNQYKLKSSSVLDLNMPIYNLVGVNIWTLVLNELTQDLSQVVILS